MIKKMFLILILLVNFLFVQNIKAEVKTNCDLCGYCEGSSEIPNTWGDCKKCLYPAASEDSGSNETIVNFPTTYPNRYYTLVGCLNTDPGDFTTQIIGIIFNIAGGIAFLYLIYGSGIIITSQANPERLNYGRKVVYGAILGLLFVFFATFIIRFIAVDVLKIPGFEG